MVKCAGSLLLAGTAWLPVTGQSRTASMNGRVLYSDLNEPIANAVIVVSNDLTRREVMTDDRGSYSFFNLTPGLYRINLKAPYLRKEQNCRLHARSVPANAIAITNNVFQAVFEKFPIKSGRATRQDFEFACESAAFPEEASTKAIQPALTMLEKKNPPFDVRILLDHEWRKKLATPFASMPELAKDLTVAHVLKGVYFARTLFLPAQVELKGDTVILTRELAPIGENSTIVITGKHDLTIFIVDDEKQYRAMTRYRSGELFRVDIGGRCRVSGLPPVFHGQFRCADVWFDVPGIEGLRP